MRRVVRGIWRMGTSAAIGTMLSAPAGADELPQGYQQILPRGHIAAIDNPRFVTASKARVPAEAWVLGVVIDGQARAYSINLLNQHEVVNDRIGGTSFAAVW